MPTPLTRAFPRLFSALGSFGCGATQAPEYRTPEPLVAHFDRVGVSHALVHHMAAREQSATSGNRWLLEAIDASPAARGRLLPALAVTPTLLWERGGVEALQQALKQSGTRALQAFPGSLRYRLFQLDQLLERIAAANPFLMVNIREVGDPRDIMDLAKAHPRVPIVCTQGMWPQMTTLFDLMSRFPNVLAETSWIHVNDTIRDLTRHFGADRVVFGLGPRAHQAAAIAGLYHADISADDKERIAWRNLAGLMGLETLSATTSAPSPEPQARASGSYWSAFLRGKPHRSDIIDAHGHLGSLSIWTIDEKDVNRQIAIALPRMDRLGIRTMIISGLEALFSDPAAHNQILADKLAPHGDRLRAYFVFNPLYADSLMPLFDTCFANPVFAGFKLLNDYWGVPVTDPRFAPMWAYADAHRLPILIHTWEGNNNSPRMLAEIAPRYPDAIFLLGHSGGGDGGRREAEALANANPNVRLEWCGSFCCRIPWEETLTRVNPRQVVFGTDGVVHDLAWELGRLLSLDVTDEVLDGIVSDNMKRVLAMRQ